MTSYQEAAGPGHELPVGGRYGADRVPVPSPMEEYSTEHCEDPRVFRPFFEEYGRLRVLADKRAVRVLSWEDRLVFKHFYTPDARRKHHLNWVREHLASHRLQGVWSARGYGYLERRLGAAREIVLCKEFVDGEVVEMVARDRLGQLVRTFSDIHAAGVTTEDPAPHNLRYRRGGYWLIDLDWAKVHRSRWVLWVKVGKELAKIRRQLFGRGGSDWREFRRQYLETVRDKPLSTALITAGYAWWRTRSRLRDWRKGRWRKGAPGGS